jgi:hypothetical protein
MCWGGRTHVTILYVGLSCQTWNIYNLTIASCLYSFQINFHCKYGEILSTYEIRLWVKPYAVLFMIDTFCPKRYK